MNHSFMKICFLSTSMLFTGCDGDREVSETRIDNADEVLPSKAASLPKSSALSVASPSNVIVIDQTRKKQTGWTQADIDENNRLRAKHAKIENDFVSSLSDKERSLYQAIKPQLNFRWHEKSVLSAVVDDVDGPSVHTSMLNKCVLSNDKSNESVVKSYRQLTENTYIKILSANPVNCQNFRISIKPHVEPIFGINDKLEFFNLR